jgi:hypothetical protein
MSERDIKVKSDILKEIMQFAQDKMGESVKSGMDEMQKVSIMAPDSEGLHEGLEKALEILPESEESESSEESDEDKTEELSPVESDSSKSEEEDKDSYYTGSGPSVANDDDEDSMFNKKMKMLKK